MTAGEDQLLALGVIQEGETRDAAGDAQGGLKRFRQALRHVWLDAEAVDHGLDGVLALGIELRRVVELDNAPIDAHAHEALAGKLDQRCGVLALAIADDRREQRHRGVFRQPQHLVHHLADGLRGEVDAVIRAARHAGTREQQAQVVVDLGDRADGRSRIVRRRLLLDRDRRREAFDGIDVRLVHHGEELARIRGKRFHVAPLPLGIQGVERQRGFARAGKAGEHDQPVPRQIEIDVLEIVSARPADADILHSGAR